jgi:hypothetical protein
VGCFFRGTFVCFWVLLKTIISRCGCRTQFGPRLTSNCDALWAQLTSWFEPTVRLPLPPVSQFNSDIDGPSLRKARELAPELKAVATATATPLTELSEHHDLHWSRWEKHPHATRTMIRPAAAGQATPEKLTNPIPRQERRSMDAHSSHSSSNGDERHESASAHKAPVEGTPSRPVAPCLPGGGGALVPDLIRDGFARLGCC